METLNLFQNERKLVQYKQGDLIFRQGDSGKCMYVIKDGEISLNIGDETEYIAISGDIFGEMSLIDSSPRSATAIAESDCELIEVDESRFTELVQETPSFSIHVMKVLAERLRYMAGA